MEYHINIMNNVLLFTLKSAICQQRMERMFSYVMESSYFLVTLAKSIITNEFAINSSASKSDRASDLGGVIGYLTVEAEKAGILTELSKNGIIDKFNIIYGGYTFVLCDTIFTAASGPTAPLGRGSLLTRLQFRARDIALQRT